MRRPKQKGRPTRPTGHSNLGQQENFTNTAATNSIDLNRIDSRCRHNVQFIRQFVEKFNNFARESISAGDRIAAEGFYQHADHYQRILNERLQDRAAAEKVQREIVETPQDESRNVYPIDPASAQQSPEQNDQPEKPAAKPVARAGRAPRVIK